MFREFLTSETEFPAMRYQSATLESSLSTSGGRCSPQKIALPVSKKAQKEALHPLLYLTSVVGMGALHHLYSRPTASRVGRWSHAGECGSPSALVRDRCTSDKESMHLQTIATSARASITIVCHVGGLFLRVAAVPSNVDIHHGQPFRMHGGKGGEWRHGGQECNYQRRIP
jgi:hypothetical protein